MCISIELLYCLTARGSAREMNKKKNASVSDNSQTIRNRNNFFFNSLQEAQRWSLPVHKSVNRLYNIWAYLIPALSWLLKVPDDAIIWPWDIVIVRESIFSVGLLLRPSPVLAAQDHCARTVWSRSQSRSTPSAVLEDTMHLVDLFLSAFAPSWIAKGSMRSISMTIAHPAAQVACWQCCSGALRAITVGAENARSRVLAGPRDSGRHFVSKCSHCACSVSHERGPNARSYVKSPPPSPGVSVAKHRAPVLQTCGLGRASSDTSKNFRFEVQTCSWKTVIGASCPPAPQSYRCHVIWQSRGVVQIKSSKSTSSLWRIKTSYKDLGCASVFILVFIRHKDSVSVYNYCIHTSTHYRKF